MACGALHTNWLGKKQNYSKTEMIIICNIINKRSVADEYNVNVITCMLLQQRIQIYIRTSFNIHVKMPKTDAKALNICVSQGPRTY